MDYENEIDDMMAAASLPDLGIEPLPFNIVMSENDKELGRITVIEGELHFEGEVDESAQCFFDHVIERNNAHIVDLKEELERERAMSAFYLQWITDCDLPIPDLKIESK